MPRGIEVTDPAAYRAKLDQSLAGRDPLDVLEQTPHRLRALFADASDAAARSRPFEGKWTPLEVLGHLIDAEWSFGWRMRTVLGDPTPDIQAMDQERWVDTQRHNEADVATLLDDFQALRAINLRLWRRLTAEELQRVGLHIERGEESLDTMRRMLAGHDESHLGQIERYLAAVGDQAV